MTMNTEMNVTTTETTTTTTEVKVDRRKGFRMGHVWLSHVRAGVGIALASNNFNKLLQTAKTMGVEVPAGADAATICKLISPKISDEMLVAPVKPTTATVQAA